MIKAMLLIAALHAPTPAPPPASVPFDCSWIYHPPTGPRVRYEGVFTSFIDDSGFYACSSAADCKEWIGKEKVEIAFSKRATSDLNKRRVNNYGVFRIVFEGRPGKLGDRPGCEANEWSLEEWGNNYVRVDKLLHIEPLEKAPR